MSRNVFTLNFDGKTLFDSSVVGSTIKASGRLQAAKDGASLRVTEPTKVEIGADKSLKGLEEFTVSVSAEVDDTSTDQTLMESQDPPVRIRIGAGGAVIGEVQTGSGWQGIKSDQEIVKGQPVSIRLIHARSGKMAIEINDKPAGSGEVRGALAPGAKSGLTLGAGTAGDAQFKGTVTEVGIQDGAVTAKSVLAANRKLAASARSVFDALGIAGGAITQPGEVDHRFAQIKAIMHGAGVEDLSRLETLSITRRTRLNPGTILLAAERDPNQPSVNWAGIATDFVGKLSTNKTQAKAILNGSLLSKSVKAQAALDMDDGASTGTVLRPGRVLGGAGPRLGTTFGTTLGGTTLRDRLTGAGARLSTATRRRTTGTVAGRAGGFAEAGTTFRGATPVGAAAPGALSERSILISSSALDVGRIARPKPLSNVVALKALEENAPGSWPVLTAAPLHMIMSTILPINSAVIIARRLDLTNQTLEIDPAVGTLYIIAEEIEASSGARITWKRTPISTPNMGNDPGLDGLDRHGKDLAPNSKNGLPGGDARDGAAGLEGHPGQSAPNVEIWALRFNGMPDIDLAGQDGGKGGRGQRGGEGGTGAQGREGKWFWAFGRRCWSGPGNGGDGGDGGDGGRGGRGGDGGDAGDILFAVLEETLDELTTTNAFSVTLAGGRRGEGGDGGARGEGGRGGRRGFTEVCSQARDGAQGQPGRVGADGPQGRNAGDEGHMQIMTVTQEAWDEQLTRPWLYDVTPDSGFPGTSLIIKGSRFADTDQIMFDGSPLSTVLRADGSLSAVVPSNATGGEHTLYSRRHDGQESNRIPFVVRPHLSGSLPLVTPGVPVTLSGQAFVTGATVEYDGGHFPANVTSPTSLTFTAPDVPGNSTTSDDVSLRVVNPDGQRSNALTAQVAGVLSNGFRLGVHDFSFANDKNGTPSWGTFEDTYGAVEVWHELLDPIFGHPILTAGFYAFYEHFLKGEDNGGLATGFCTALASLALDRFWLGNNDTFTSVVRDAAFRRQMTAVHGRLLSRESLLSFHDQGRRGNANVISTFRAIETTFMSGGTRDTAPMLFFVPAGAAWDSGYFDMLADSHCIVPTRIVYPPDYDGGSIAGVKMFCWDNNHPNTPECFVEFREEAGQTLFHYVANGADKFDSSDGITLAVATLGEYLLRDVDLPFSGPLGLTTFIIDFLLSPATMTINDDDGRVTGHVGGQILSEIPDSHPAYLMPGMFMLPQSVGLTRRITGNANGNYGYHSINPDGLSVSMEGVPTLTGQVDRVLANADGSRVRFVPAADKQVNMTLGRRVGDRVRGLSIEKFNASPANDLDITAAPDLSMVRVSNQGPDVDLDVKFLNFDVPSETRNALSRSAVTVPTGADLVVAVTNWDDLIDANVTTTAIS